MGVREKLQRTPIRRSRREVVLDGAKDAWRSFTGPFRRDDSGAKKRAGAAAAGVAGVGTAAFVAKRTLAGRGQDQEVQPEVQPQERSEVPAA